MQFGTRWVMVTGASSGLGLEMSRQLARDYKANLVLVARRGDRLETLKHELEGKHGVRVQPVVADLSREDDVERAFREATSEHDLYGVILNAGITHFGEHLDLSWTDFRTMLATNINAVAHLTHLSVPYLLERKQSGGLMLVSSLTGVMPLPYQAAYSGTKAFMVGFGQSLEYELRGKAVSVTNFIPGGIATEMSVGSGLSQHFGDNSPYIQTVEVCAKDAIEAFRLRKRTYVPGWFNRFGVLSGKLLPRALTVGVAIGMEYRKALALKKGT
jgi:short-subunit dehydrogenase